ncbi:MAG: hypothetical protein FWG32_02665 [Oscillospiraceae bacterium]|nr:hypothetical protein [Oscillospiraceae bacterium]
MRILHNKTSRAVSLVLTVTFILICLMSVTVLAANGDVDSANEYITLVAGQEYRTYLTSATNVTDTVPQWITVGTTERSIKFTIPTVTGQIRVFEYREKTASNDAASTKLYIAPKAATPAKDDISVCEVDFTNATMSVKSGYQYQIGANTNPWINGGGAAIDVQAVKVRTVASGAGTEANPFVPASPALSVTKPGTWSVPAASYDKVNDKIKITPIAGVLGYHWRLKTPDNSEPWAFLTPAVGLAAGLYDLPAAAPGKTIQIRVAGGAAAGSTVAPKLASGAKDLAVPATGPSAPTGMIEIDYKKELLGGLTAAMEYRVGTGGWAVGKSNIQLTAILNNLTGVTSTDIQVRYKSVAAKAGNPAVVAGDIEVLTLNARAAKPVYTLDIPNETLLSGGAFLGAAIKDSVFGLSAVKLEKYIDNGTAAEDEEELSAWISANAGKRIYVATAATASDPRSFPAEISIPSRQPAPKVSTLTVNRDYKTEDGFVKALAANAELRSVTETVHYDAYGRKMPSTFDYGAWGTADIALNIDDYNGTGTGYYVVPAAIDGEVTNYVEVRIRYAASGTLRLSSVPVKITMTRATAPNITADWANELFKGFLAAKKYEYMVDTTGVWTDVPPGATSVKMEGDLARDTVDKVVLFREKTASVATGLASNTKELMIPAASYMPPPVEGVDFEFNYSTYILRAIPVAGEPAVQFSVNSGASWSTLTAAAAGINLSTQIENAAAAGDLTFKILLRFTAPPNTPLYPFIEFDVGIQGAPDPEIIYDPDTGEFLNAGAEHEYRMGKTGAWQDFVPGTIIPPTNSSQTAQFRLKAAGSSVAGKIQQIDIASQKVVTVPASAPDVTVAGFKITGYTPAGGNKSTAVSNLEWSLNGDKYSTYTSGWSLEPLFGSLAPGADLVLYVRVKASGNAVPSDPVIIIVDANTGNAL